MKISDIVGGRKSSSSVPSRGDEEAEKLIKQKEDIEMENKMEEFEPPTQEQQPGFFPPGAKQQESVQPNMSEMSAPTEPRPPIPRPPIPPHTIQAPVQQEVIEDYNPPKQFVPLPNEEPVDIDNEPKSFKISIILEGGQKLPIMFKCMPEDVEGVLKDFDDSIKHNEVITIGDFKIPGEKILYIDLLGR